MTGTRAVAATALALVAACAHKAKLDTNARAVDTRSCTGADADGAWHRLREIPPSKPDGNADDARQEAEFALGQGLSCMGFFTEAMAVWDGSAQRAGARTDLDRSIADALSSLDQTKPTHPIDLPTLRSLVLLWRRFPDWNRQLDAFGACERGDLERPEVADVRDDLLYLGGLARYQQGHFKEARAFFAALAPASPFFVKAKLYEGASHVREYHGHPALAAFAAALNALLRSAVPNRELIDLANLSLARTFYSMGRFDMAANRYDAVRPGSVHWNERLFESAWTAYMMHIPAAALERLREFEGRAETVPPEVTAEGLQLQAAVLLSQGNHQAAAAAIDRFNATAPALFQGVKALLQNIPDDAALFDLAVRVRAGTSGLVPAVDRTVRIAASDAMLARRFAFVAEVQDEINRFQKADPSWTRSDLGRVVQANLAVRRTEAVKEAGNLLRRRLNRTVQELGLQIKRVIAPEWEPLRAHP